MLSSFLAVTLLACACSTPAAPAPQPAPCGGDAATTDPFTATAVWQSANDAGTIVLKITVHRVDPNFSGQITFGTSPLITNQTPINASDILVTVRPLVGVHTVGIDFSVSCLKKTGTIVVTWTADPVDGRSDPTVVTLST